MRQNNFLLAPIVAISLVLFGCQVDKKITYDIIIKNGNIIDLETGSVSVQNILIIDGSIEKLTPPNETDKISATQIIDATDMYILPGFWDNHVHFRGGDSLIRANKELLKLYIANGITTVRDAGGDLTSSVLAWRDSIAYGKLIGPMIFTSGPKIDGPNGTWAGSLAVSNEEEITSALDSLQSIPVDFVKLYDSRITGEMYLNTLKAAEERGLITSGHMPFTVTLDETIAAGVDAVEHLYYIMKGASSAERAITDQLIAKNIGFWDAMPMLMETYSDSTAQNTFSNLRSNNVYVVPTLHIGETLSYLDETDHQNDAYLKYIDSGILKTYEGRIQGALNASEEKKKNRKALQKFFGELTKSLHGAGVGLLAGSDSGAYNSYTYPGVSLHAELQQLVNAGISPLEALKTSAYNGARFLKKDTDYGSITPGKIADLVLLEANPLKHIGNTKKIGYVIVSNKIYTKEDLEGLLNSVELTIN